MLEKGLLAYLASVGAVTSIVSSRIYLTLMPEDVTYPALCCIEVSGVRDHTIDGVTGLAHPRFQISCWGETFTAARDLATAVRQALDNQKGTWNFTGGSVVVQSCFLVDERSMFEDAPRCYRHDLDFEIWFQET